jgi:sulfur relay (sulfurtransferase) complex TusBCD TusD component (DsrE family)
MRAAPRPEQLPVEMKTLVVLNDPAYGTERSYNGLRLAHSLAIHEEQLVDGAHRSNLEDLTDWLLWADKVVAF